MKVGTDGVILGAWTNLEGCSRALDLGTGTGLLALMLAQRSQDLGIDAIEIDKNAADQARENIKASIFSSQIRVFNQDFKVFQASAGSRYDLIICNPPFFKDSFKPHDPGRKLARHSEALQIDEILMGSARILSEKGRLSLIIPAVRERDIVSSAERLELFPERKLEIISSPGKDPIRVCLEFGRVSGEIQTEELLIEEGQRHSYSAKYKYLTRDFYLDP